MKKNILCILSATVLFIFISCNKSKEPDSPIQGTWYIKSIRCYQDPTQYWIPYIYPNSYYKFNPDKTGEQYNAGTSSSSYFTYAMLNNDSTFTITSKGNRGITQLDTFIIIKLTPNEFIYHSARTYLTSTALCFNVLDSLYR